MRKTGFVLLALAALTPLAIYGYILRAQHHFEQVNGYAPEGKGFLELVYLGNRGMFYATLLAAALAIAAYVRVPAPRPARRRFEVVLMGLPVVLIFLLAANWFPNWQTTLFILTGVPIDIPH